MPYIDDDEGTRIARRIDTGEAEYVPGNMKYGEWKERFVENPLRKNPKKSIIPMDFSFFAEYLSKQDHKSFSYGIRNLKSLIRKHESKIANPEKYMKNWDIACDQEKIGTVESWRKKFADIRNR